MMVIKCNQIQTRMGVNIADPNQNSSLTVRHKI